MTAGLLTVGFVGLGKMGRPLATNLVKTGHDVLVYDKDKSPELTPEGARRAASLTEVARLATVVVLSLPDGGAVHQVADGLLATRGALQYVVDTSTVGVAAARRLGGVFAAQGVAYVDAPVSGGIAGAVNRSIAVIFSGGDEAFSFLRPILDGLSDRVFRVGCEPGLGQAVKVANNFLSATALIATSEVVNFGEKMGLDTEVMVKVLNNASGHNTATSDKFPNHILTGRFASGFSNRLMDKDLRLYTEAVTELGLSGTVGDVISSYWHRFSEDQLDVDFTRIYPYVRELPGDSDVIAAFPLDVSEQL